MNKGEPPQPSKSWARRNNITGPVVDGDPSMQFSLRLLWGASGGDDSPKNHIVISNTPIRIQFHQRTVKVTQIYLYLTNKQIYYIKKNYLKIRNCKIISHCTMITNTNS